MINMYIPASLIGLHVSKKNKEISKKRIMILVTNTSYKSTIVLNLLYDEIIEFYVEVMFSIKSLQLLHLFTHHLTAKASPARTCYCL